MALLRGLEEEKKNIYRRVNVFNAGLERAPTNFGARAQNTSQLVVFDTSSLNKESAVIMSDLLARCLMNASANCVILSVSACVDFWIMVAVLT